MPWNMSVKKITTRSSNAVAKSGPERLQLLQQQNKITIIKQPKCYLWKYLKYGSPLGAYPNLSNRLKGIQSCGAWRLHPHPSFPVFTINHDPQVPATIKHDKASLTYWPFSITISHHRQASWPLTIGELELIVPATALNPLQPMGTSSPSKSIPLYYIPLY